MAKLYATTIMWFISCPFKLFNLFSDQRQSLFLYGEFHNKSMMVLEIPFGHVVFTMQLKYFIWKKQVSRYSLDENAIDDPHYAAVKGSKASPSNYSSFSPIPKNILIGNWSCSTNSIPNNKYFLADYQTILSFSQI